jgi:hypothetical protein
MNKWYEWDSLASFESWHQTIIIELGLPIVSVNQATGEPEPNATETVTYTNPFEVEGKTIALVEDAQSAGLTETNLRPFSPPPPLL